VSTSPRTTVSDSQGAPTTAGRPASVTAVAVLTALAGVLILAYGVYLCVAGLAGQPVLRARAETGGAIFACFGLGVAWVGLALARVQPWARTPAMLTHLFIVIISYPMFQVAKFTEGLPLALYGLTGLVLLFVPASHRVLSR
jgi:hypothetical protein